jgi:molybdate transport system ATP-binding protein
MLSLDINYENEFFSLEIKHDFQEEITGLFGVSGSGKTSLLNLISGFLTPTHGKIILDNQPIFDSELAINVPPHLRRIGTVFQDSRLFPHLSVERNIKYGYNLTNESERKIQLDDVVELLEIRDHLKKLPNKLSGGERQRVALARALLMSPRLLLLDEPLASLDLSLKKQILPYLKRVKDEINLPMIYVSHDIEEIDFLTSKILKISNGRISC